MKQTGDEQNQTLRKYLLNDLPEPEREQIELQLLTDKEFSRRLAIAQDDLIDNFVAERLSESELESFRKHYLTTPARLQKVKFASALDKYVSAKSAVPEVAPFKQPRAYWQARPLKTAFAAAGLVLILGAALFVVTRIGWFHRDDFQAEFARVNRAQEVDLMPFSDLKLSSSNTVVLILRQNLVRENGEVRRVDAAGGLTLIRLLLEVPSDSHASYTVVLQTAAGEDLVSTGGLKARNDNGAQFVVANVPAKFLTRGDYQLKLLGIDRDGRTTDIGLYPFQVNTR